jgi:phosphatidylglycerol---prolipoprotein diacylglyceryl transferase
MLPSLRLFGNFALPGYGTMLFISFVVGVVLLDRRLRARAMLPAELKYNWAWQGTDIFISVIVLLIGVWAVLFSPLQWAWLSRATTGFRLVFRIGAAALAIYLIYGSIDHIIVYRRRKNIESNQFTTYLTLWILFAAIIGSRLLYIFLHWSEFEHDLVGTFAFWRGGLQGLVFYGGFLGALVMGLLFARLNRVPLLGLLDAATPSVMLGEFFTRIGCFLNGCCFGRACNLPWAVTFPPNAPASVVGGPVHPTELYSSLAGLILFGIALLFERRKWRSGMVFGVMLVLYSAFRFLIDFVRYYENAANLWTNQFIALGLTAIGVAVILIARRQKPAGSPAA